MAIQKSVKQSAIVDNNDKKIISLINEIGSQINVFVKASNSIDTVDANINKQKEQLAAEIAAIKAKHGLIIDQEKKEKKLINQLKDDTKKRIDNLITPLRAAKVVIGNKDKKCPYALALWDSMGDLSTSSKSNYLSIIRACLKSGDKFSTNPSRDKGAKVVKEQKDTTKGVLETHVKTKDKPVKTVFETVLPELIELCNELISNSISQDILMALQDALELVHKLPATK
jgi:vacuolar-type H+-ATPase subunit I/STV1